MGKLTHEEFRPMLVELASKRGIPREAANLLSFTLLTGILCDSSCDVNNFTVDDGEGGMAEIKLQIVKHLNTTTTCQTIDNVYYLDYMCDYYVSAMLTSDGGASKVFMDAPHLVSITTRQNRVNGDITYTVSSNITPSKIHEKECCVPIEDRRIIDVVKSACAGMAMRQVHINCENTHKEK